MLRQVAHIHVYRQTVVIGDLRFAENQRSKIVLKLKNYITRDKPTCKALGKISVHVVVKVLVKVEQIENAHALKSLSFKSSLSEPRGVL